MIECYGFGQVFHSQLFCTHEDSYGQVHGALPAEILQDSVVKSSFVVAMQSLCYTVASGWVLT